MRPNQGVDRLDGVATTGSAGEALALQCGTPWHHNEIVAHAQAAARLRPGADTVLEIGGQDAKFIRLCHGVPSDFAMNGSCAAGTGSFIEEAARTELGVRMAVGILLLLSAGLLILLIWTGVVGEGGGA